MDRGLFANLNSNEWLLSRLPGLCDGKCEKTLIRWNGHDAREGPAADDRVNEWRLPVQQIEHGKLKLMFCRNSFAGLNPV